MKTTITLFSLFTICFSWSQSNFGDPTDQPIPDKLQNLKVEISVMQFPEENDPVKIKDLYYWKHATGILSIKSTIVIREYGAYIFYDNQWNLRKVYPLKELDKTFGTKKQTLLQGQPYVWNNNWRVDSRLVGGWALWYFIGENSDGEIVCGYKKINTTNNLLN